MFKDTTDAGKDARDGVVGPKTLGTPAPSGRSQLEAKVLLNTVDDGVEANLPQPPASTRPTS